MMKTCTREQALLTNQRPQPHVGRRLSESTTLATSLIVYCSSIVSFFAWLHIYLACNWKAETQDWLRSAWSDMSVPSGVTSLPPNQEGSFPQLLAWFHALLMINKTSSSTLLDSPHLAG
uniref:Protein S-acyltransferase n=1 Tax=Mesocestoides corti TaxID=53468 RepID=A0A5K3FKT4_MESCO